MTFNLIDDRWLPCLRASGARVWLAPHDITSDFDIDPIVALDFPRPDWNAAVTELLIGLVSTVIPPKDNQAWAEQWITPPVPEMLAQALMPLTFAFNLDGDEPRCFQDYDTLAKKELNDIGALLIDAPGASTAKKNTDLFVKRDGITSLCLPYAAAALITLQTYAPSGGAGHRTSMRGGGPLSLLLAPRRQHARLNGITTLWDVVWCNVWTGHDQAASATTFSAKKPSAARIFPWLAPTRSSTKDEPTIPVDDADHLQVFFGMPRRVRLSFSSAGEQKCSLNGPHGDGLVASSYRTETYGMNYTAWKHPLSPYYTDKKNGLLPVHPQAGLTTYADWYAWWGLNQGASALHIPANLKAWPDRLRAISMSGAINVGETRQRGVNAVGFDMDNMKARGWLDERIPYFELPPDAKAVWGENFQQLVAQLVDGAKVAASALKYELRRSNFAKRDGDSFKLLDNAPKDAFDDVATTFWQLTENSFVLALEKLHASDATDSDRALREAFLQVLRNTALRLFDEATDIDTLADQDAKRLVETRRSLTYAVSNTGKVATALGLVEQKPKRGKRP